MEPTIFQRTVELWVETQNDEVMRRDFSEHRMMQVTITDNQLGTIQMMEEGTEHVGMNYPEITDSRFKAQTFDDFLFPWDEEMGSAENPI